MSALDKLIEWGDEWQDTLGNGRLLAIKDGFLLEQARHELAALRSTAARVRNEALEERDLLARSLRHAVSRTHRPSNECRGCLDIIRALQATRETGDKAAE